MTEETVNKTRLGWLLLTAIILGMCGGVLALPQNSPPPATSQPISASQVIQFLNQTIKWHRHLSAEQRISFEPDDQLVVYNNRQVADQVVRLSFDFARAEADILAKQAASNPLQNSGGAPEQYQALRSMEETLEKTVKDTQTELDSNRQKLSAATGHRRQELASQVSELQAELELAKTRREAVHSMVEFVSGTSSNGLGATGLRAQIEALAASIPAAALNPPTGRQPAATPQGSVPPAGANATYSGSDVSGIWDITDDIFSQSSHVRTIDSLIAQTNALSQAAKNIRAPLTMPLRELFRTSDELAAQADTANPAQLDQEKKQLDGLATQFKQITSASMPLSKQSVLLTLYLRNLTNWREAVDGRRKADWRSLGVRLGFLALIVGIVLISAEVWRRAVYRYVQEPRQRYQFLLLRRFVLWLVIALIFAFILAGRLTSIVTFAGLLTAGVAVALQSVILSTVGYFFLIGKFGIRVGDRVQIGSVTGEVIEIGLVRLHLMELGSGGFGAPTGRVVAFSNSIVFQPSSGLFKQISGANFNWHEARLALPRTADLASIKEKLLKVVAGVLADYSTELELQYREMRRTVQSVPADGLNPKIQLRILPASVEAVIRFPVSFRNESEIDERVSQALLKAVENDPSLKAPGADTPAVHLRTDLSAADAAG